jgi:hypothetical protein
MRTQEERHRLTKSAADSAAFTVLAMVIIVGVLFAITYLIARGSPKLPMMFTFEVIFVATMAYAVVRESKAAYFAAWIGSATFLSYTVYSLIP